MPFCLHGFWTRLERLLEPEMHTLAMFAFIALRKN